MVGHIYLKYMLNWIFSVSQNVLFELGHFEHFAIPLFFIIMDHLMVH